MSILRVLKPVGSKCSAELGLVTQVVLQITCLAVRHRCAGLCQYERGGGCRIKLSEPLLKVCSSDQKRGALQHNCLS